MVDLATLDELIARVEKATVGDRLIDADLYRLELGVWADTSIQWNMCADYTASIDAALGLVERMLPGWMVVNLCEWEADVLRARGAWLCCLKKIGTQDDFTAAKGKADHAPSAPLAIILALLQALRESSERGR